MLSPRQNMEKVLKREQPDYYGDFMAAQEWIMDPLYLRDRCPKDGKLHKDSWGTAFCFMPGSPGAHPVVNAENCVIKDIEHWQDYVKIPTLEGLDWTAAEEQAASIDRTQKYAAMYCSAGLFERSHHLQGIENALCNYMEYPDEMGELLRAIADYKIAYIKKVAEHCHPDIIFYHDDWGTKQNVFLPPDLWRELIKPLQKEIAQTIHDCGMIYMHHADCVCQPLVLDMLDIGIDIWQGTIPQNDIVEIQRITEGRLPMIGGIDGPKIVVDYVTDDEIRAEVRRAFDTYIPGGPFFPSIANGCCFIKHNNDVYLDELNKYGHIYAQEHPVR